MVAPPILMAGVAAVCLRSTLQRLEPVVAAGRPHANRHDAVAGLADRDYTTNYDRWLEISHAEFGVKYDRIASVADMVAVSDGNRQIIKFHGDFAADESIVLDETSYYQRLNFDTPLDIKLRNDVLSNSVLFIGYSLTDFNIRLLFYRLTEMWGNSPLASARPKSYVFTNRLNPAAEEVLRHWGIEMIVSDEDDPKTALTDFLQELVTSPGLAC